MGNLTYGQAKTPPKPVRTHTKTTYEFTLHDILREFGIAVSSKANVSGNVVTDKMWIMIEEST